MGSAAPVRVPAAPAAATGQRTGSTGTQPMRSIAWCCTRTIARSCGAGSQLVAEPVVPRRRLHRGAAHWRRPSGWPGSSVAVRWQPSDGVVARDAADASTALLTKLGPLSRSRLISIRRCPASASASRFGERGLVSRRCVPRASSRRDARRAMRARAGSSEVAPRQRRVASESNREHTVSSRSASATTQAPARVSRDARTRRRLECRMNSAPSNSAHSGVVRRIRCRPGVCSYAEMTRSTRAGRSGLPSGSSTGWLSPNPGTRLTSYSRRRQERRFVSRNRHVEPP